MNPIDILAKPDVIEYIHVGKNCSTDESEAYLPWDTYHFPGLRGGLKPTSFEGYFHQIWTHWLLEEWEPGVDLIHRCIQGFQTQNRF